MKAALVIALLVASVSLACASQGPPPFPIPSSLPCAEPSNVARDLLTSPPNPAIRVLPGDYVLHMVATEGSKRGATATGRLWLRSMSTSGYSPTPGRPAWSPSAISVLLYGATDVDLRAVGAPIDPDTKHPEPTSFDPARPGVVAHANILRISTISNLPWDTVMSDGSGIGLGITSIDAEGFSGVWKEWGILMGGRGYFCACRVR